MIFQNWKHGNFNSHDSPGPIWMELFGANPKSSTHFLFCFRRTLDFLTLFCTHRQPYWLRFLTTAKEEKIRRRGGNKRNIKIQTHIQKKKYNTYTPRRTQRRNSDKIMDIHGQTWQRKRFTPILRRWIDNSRSCLCHFPCLFVSLLVQASANLSVNHGVI